MKKAVKNVKKDAKNSKVGKYVNRAVKNLEKDVKGMKNEVKKKLGHSGKDISLEEVVEGQRWCNLTNSWDAYEHNFKGKKLEEAYNLDGVEEFKGKRTLRAL